MKKREHRILAAVGSLLLPLAALAAVLCLLAAVSNLSAGSGDEGRQRLEDSLRRAAVTCYATEGIYPPTLDYLDEHYGIQIDAERYTVYYEVFAENLMPDITVLKNGG